MQLREYFVHVEIIIFPCGVGVFVFSGAFPRQALTSFLLTKMMNVWGGGGKGWKLQGLQAGPADRGAGGIFREEAAGLQGQLGGSGLGDQST